ncbi:MAG: tetratricopeptide repeat protein [Bacteroidia bacterium]|nr:tetratricopeptide repeat protein [Bacteroidia bacterium]
MINRFIHSGIFLRSKYVIHALMVLLMLPLTSIAKMQTEQFKLANEHFQKGNYKEAIQQYEAIINAGYEAPELYFNLGNAHYKNSNIPAAILNYERALKLSPGDTDTEFNLKLANSQTIDKIELLPEVFYKRWLNKWLMNTPAENKFSWVIILLWICLAWTAAWLFIPVRWIKQIAFACALISLSGSISVYAIATWQQKQIRSDNYAIIFQSNVYVKSSPDEKSANLFMLHGGTKVKMMDELSGWKRIRLPNGHEGWIQENALEKI